MPEAIICDTSVWLYMGRIDQANLLAQLYHPVYTTDVVCHELDIARLRHPDTLDPRQLPWVSLVQGDPQAISNLPANRLGPGERSVLAYAQANPMQIVGLDDRQARVLAHQLGLRVMGTIGVLLKTKESGLITVVRPLLEQLRQEGFHISPALLTYTLQRAKET
ncbi:MAG: DUF3368 domain-containing protein [Candidatus Promineifilaceae bacterium]